MTVWRYTAVATDTEPRVTHTGELAGDCAADVRAALRRIGLQVVDLRPLRHPRLASGRSGWWSDVPNAMRSSLHRYLRHRRQSDRAELYDGLATMLASGLPLLEACETVAGSIKRKRSALRLTLIDIRERLRSGSSLAAAMGEHPSWFDRSEIAMVQAGQHSGRLEEVLKSLSDRQERSGELSRTLVNALAYPVIVAMVGLGVVIFLSVKTLPDLVQVLVDAGVSIPTLTAGVMAFGQFLAGHWHLIGLALIIIAVTVVGGTAVMGARDVELPTWLRHVSPRVIRRVAVARVSLQLAELLQTGVPMVEALRVLAPTTSMRTLRRRLLAAADRTERGEDVAAALDDEYWFDGQFRRILEIGQASGELDVLLERIGHRYSRQARRLIDRLAALLEPFVILMLATLVGVVVMAAILPLLRLQEVL